jgi:uncharacterized protein
MTRVLLLALLAYGILMGAISLLQDRLLYFPEKASLHEVLADARSQGLQRWPAEGTFRGLVRAPEGQARATLVLFHGNAGHVGHRAHYARLSRHGVRVILAEYPGYGPRQGELGEAQMSADATETIALAHRTYGAPVLVAGESLGSGVAAAAYTQVPQSVAGLLLMTPWDSLVDVASHHYPWLPVPWLLRDRYDTQRHLAAARVPVAVVVAENDTIVPARFGQRLYEQLNAPKRIWTLPHAGHNDWLDTVDDRWWAMVLNFLLQDQGLRLHHPPP